MKSGDREGLTAAVAWNRPASAGRLPHVLLLPSWYPTAEDPISGVFFREQAQALRSSGGLQVGVVAPLVRSLRGVRPWSAWRTRFQIRSEDDAGVPTYRSFSWSVPQATRLNQRVWSWQAWRMAERYRRVHGMPSVIHVHGAVWAASAARSIARRWRIPYVVTEHTSAYEEGLLRPAELSWARTGLRGAARVIAVSRALARQLEPLLAAGQPLDVVPNMVDTTFFVLPENPRRATPFRFLTVGLFDPVKATDVLLRAFAEAFAGRDDVLLDVGGDGALDGPLRRLAHELGIAAQVRFLGRLSRVQVRDAMWSANAFVLPSHIETFGVVLIEAMATGLPVVSTACGGPQDTVVPGETGLLVPPGSPAALAGAMRSLAAEYDRWGVRAASIREHVQGRYASPVVVGRLIATYGQVATFGTVPD